jgi:hypothetical protein
VGAILFSGSSCFGTRKRQNEIPRSLLFWASLEQSLYAPVVLNSGVLPRVRPMLLRLVKEPFDDPDYIFELKQVGFRATAYIDHGDAAWYHAVSSAYLSSLCAPPLPR